MARDGRLLLARGRSLCRAGEIDRPNPVSPLDQASYEFAAKVPGRTARLQTRSIGFSSAKNYGSGVSKLAW